MSDGQEDPSHVSNKLNERLEARRDAARARDERILDIVTSHFWQRILDVHRATSIEQLSQIRTEVERVDRAIIDMQVNLPNQETLKKTVKEALQLSSRFLSKCHPDEKDEKEILETKRALAKKIVIMRIRAVVAFESFTLGEPRGPEKFARVLVELVKAGLVHEDEVPIITEEVYPKDAKVVPFRSLKT